jgi:hypothetical protein
VLAVAAASPASPARPARPAMPPGTAFSSPPARPRARAAAIPPPASASRATGPRPAVPRGPAARSVAPARSAIRRRTSARSDGPRIEGGEPGPRRGVATLAAVSRRAEGDPGSRAPTSSEPAARRAPLGCADRRERRLACRRARARRCVPLSTWCARQHGRHQGRSALQVRRSRRAQGHHERALPQAAPLSRRHRRMDLRLRPDSIRSFAHLRCWSACPDRHAGLWPKGRFVMPLVWAGRSHSRSPVDPWRDPSSAPRA